MMVLKDYSEKINIKFKIWAIVLIITVFLTVIFNYYLVFSKDPKLLDVKFSGSLSSNSLQDGDIMFEPEEISIDKSNKGWIQVFNSSVFLNVQADVIEVYDENGNLYKTYYEASIYINEEHASSIISFPILTRISKCEILNITEGNHSSKPYISIYYGLKPQLTAYNGIYEYSMEGISDKNMTSSTTSLSFTTNGETVNIWAGLDWPFNLSTSLIHDEIYAEGFSFQVKGVYSNCILNVGNHCFYFNNDLSISASTKSLSYFDSSGEITLWPLTENEHLIESFIKEQISDESLSLHSSLNQSYITYLTSTIDSDGKMISTFDGKSEVVYIDGITANVFSFNKISDFYKWFFNAILTFIIGIASKSSWDSARKKYFNTKKINSAKTKLK